MFFFQIMWHFNYLRLVLNHSIKYKLFIFFGPTQCNGKFISLSYQVNPNLVASLSIFYE